MLPRGLAAALPAQNGLLSALPYLFTWIANLLVGPVADFLLARNVLSVLLVRKLFTTLGERAGRWAGPGLGPRLAGHG